MHFDWWTLLLQTINVLVLLAVLRHFLFRPLQAALARRQQELRQAGDAAGLARRQAEDERQALAAQRQALDDSRAQLMQEARAQAQAQADAQQAAAEQAAAAQAEAARQQLARERLAAEAQLRQSALALVEGIAARLLRRVPQANPDQAFLEQALAGLPPQGEDDPIEVVTARALDPQAQAEWRASAARQLGHPVTLRFGCEPELLAGVELRAHSAVVRNHWRADLERIMEALRHDAAEQP